TTNGPHGLHIDYILANDALLDTATVVPGTYTVHIPADDPTTWPSDHRRISCTLRIHPTHTTREQ
ncbi:hypothetical protein, partial [Micromonospora rifamycinica]